jgi:hypothetical protein
MNNYLDIIKYRGTKQFFAALGKYRDKWIVLIAPVGKIDVYSTLNTQTTVCLGETNITFPIYEDIGTNIHFKIDKNNTCYHLISLNNEKDFDIVIATLESIYGTE